MVTKTLTEFSSQKNAIISSIALQISRGNYDKAMHDAFKPSKLNINEIESILSSIEQKIRKIEIIVFTYFETEYDPNIIVNRTMPASVSMTPSKVIETEFVYDTNLLKNRIEFNTPELYKEQIDNNFRTFILTIASLYEVLVKLFETLLKKIVLYDGERHPYQSIPFKTFLLNWDKLVDLGYRKNDEFYMLASSHRAYLDKYLNQINSLRNSFIHGYNDNIIIDTASSQYIVKVFDANNFPNSSGFGISTELILNTFVQNILSNSVSITSNFLNLFASKISHHMRKLPI